MYNRKKYKKYACVQLKRRWTIPVLATIIYLVVSAMINIPEFFNTTENLLPVNSAAEFLMDSFFLIELCIVFIIVYAQLNLHLKMSRGPEKITFGDFLEGFSKFGRAILCGAWEFLWTFLWFCLFAIQES